MSPATARVGGEEGGVQAWQYGNGGGGNGNSGWVGVMLIAG